MKIPSRKAKMTAEERLERYGKKRMSDKNSQLLGDNIGLFYGAMKAMGLKHISNTDVGRDILLAVCQQMNKFDPSICSISTYIYNTVRWSAWHCIRSDRKRQGENPKSLEDYNSFHEPLSKESSDHVLSGALEDAMTSLTPSQSKLIKLYFVKCFTMSEIAILMKISRQRIKQKIDQVLIILRRKMICRIKNYKDYE